MSRQVVAAHHNIDGGGHKIRRCAGGWANRWLRSTTGSDDSNNSRSKICAGNGSSNRSSWAGSNRSSTCSRRWCQSWSSRSAIWHPAPIRSSTGSTITGATNSQGETEQGIGQSNQLVLSSFSSDALVVSVRRVWCVECCVACWVLWGMLSVVMCGVMCVVCCVCSFVVWKNDYHSHRPALIQIEYVRQRSVILLVEVGHLPHRSSALFWLIQSLFKVILQPSNRILSWGDGASELSAFLPCGLFSMTMVDQTCMINVQDSFRRGYNRRYPHACGLPSDDDHPSCTCLYRPVKNRHNPWSLQKAVAWTFCQFLDKSYTNSNWSRCLDSGDVRSSLMVEYAAHDCLAVTKIFAVIENKWTNQYWLDDHQHLLLIGSLL